MSSHLTALSVLKDDLLKCTKAFEDFVSQYMDANTPIHHTYGQSSPLALLEDMCRIMNTTSSAMNASFNRADGRLRRFRNLHIHINILPDNILLLIFQYASDFYEIEEKLNVIEVCWRWRNLCLEHPQFWCEFFARHTPRYAIPRAVRYSRDLPLTVFVGVNDEIKSRKVVFGLAQSIERLRVMFAKSPGQRKNTWLDKTWPILRELDLGLARASYGWDDLIAPIKGRADKLRILTLENLRFPYAAQNYRNLHVLRFMSNTPDPKHRSGRPNDGLLTDALRGSPNLRVLKLKDPPTAIKHIMLPREAVIQPVYLLRLRSLDMNMALQKVSLLLRHFRTSANTLLSTRIRAHRWRDEVTALFRDFDQTPDIDIDKTLLLELPGPESFPIISRLQSISIRDVAYQRVAGSIGALDREYLSWISSWDFVSILCNSDGEEHAPPFTFDIAFDNIGTWYDGYALAQPSWRNLVRSLLRHHAPLTEMRVLRLDQLEPTYPYLGQLAVAMPRVRTLVLHKCKVPKVLQALLDGGPLPELTTLGVIKCFLTKEDATELIELADRLQLKLVVVRVKENLERYKGRPRNAVVEDAELWPEVEQILQQDKVEVEIQYLDPWVQVDPPNGWWFRQHAYI